MFNSRVSLESQNGQPMQTIHPLQPVHPIGGYPNEYQNLYQNNYQHIHSNSVVVTQPTITPVIIQPAYSRDHLCLSIISSFFCFVFGLIAVYFSCTAREAKNNNQILEAAKRSRTAFNLSITGIIFGLFGVPLIIYGIIAISLAVETQ